MIIRGDGTRLLVAALLAIVANLGLLGVASLLVREEPQRVFPSIRVPIDMLRVLDRVEPEPRPRPRPEPPPEETVEPFIPDFGRPSIVPARPGPPALSIEIGDPGLAARDLDFVFQAGDLDQPPRVVSRVPPIYPFRARQRGIEGFVRVRFLVAPDGAISRVSILTAEPEGVFEDSVLQILPRWRIEPGRIDGEAVHSWMVTTVHFELTR